MSGQDEAARDDRPVRRTPRRACLPWFNPIRPVVSGPDVLPGDGPFVTGRGSRMSGPSIDRSGVVSGMFGDGLQPAR